MKNLYIYEINRQTMNKRIFKLLINVEQWEEFKDFKDIATYVSSLDNSKSFYTWEIKEED